jgi:hypothetical protein
VSYIVLMRFADLQDGNRIYEAGDNYPRPGFDVSPERLAELAGSDNRMGEPLIVDVEAPCDKCAVEAPETPVKAPQDKLKEIPAQSQEPPKKTRRSRQKG